MIIETQCFNNQSEFARKLGMTQPAIAGWLKRNTIDYIRVLEAFPNISAEWLLRGEGEMLKSSSSVSNVQTNVKVGGNNIGVIGSGHMHGGNDDYIKRLEKTVEKQNERIDKLIAIIEKK